MEDSNIYIYGRNPVDEALSEEPEKIEKIYVRENIRNSSIQQIHDKASQNRIPVTHVPGRKLYDLVGKVNDQGVVALLSTIEYQEFEDWLDGVDISDKPGVLLLDEIEDPHNVGAILRTAAAAGIHAILVPKHRQAPINATVYKTSAGTAGRIPIVRLGNLNQSIMKMKDAGFWICGLDQNSEKTYWQQDYDMPMGFVIGNEGHGIRQKTLEHCDFTVSMPMHNRVSSLNASVSAALISYEWLRKREK